MLKKFTFLMIIALNMFFCYQSYSMPAKPGLIEFTQPDGSKVNIYLHGDEKVKWATTQDGYTLLFNADGYYEYAVLDYRNNLVTSGIVAQNPQNRDLLSQSFLEGVSKSLTYSPDQISTLKQIWNIYDEEAKNGSKAFPTTGSRKLVCILIGFTDRAFVKTQAEFDALFNQVGYTAGGATGSIKDYYLENSWNQFNLTVDVKGPFTAANNMSYYGANDASGNDLRPRELVAEAVNLADATTNYAEYDNDNNGTVDAVYIIYAGYGEESGAPTTTIWAHAWAITPVVKDGKTISSYSCSSELRGTTGTNITRIGVICHEFGHTLGADDFYDTDYATGGQYDGTGAWDLMGGGGWNNGGATPSHHNPFTKIYVYGWASAVTLSTAQNVAVLNSVQNSNSFYRYNTTTTNEFFLIENRQQIGFDSFLPGHGMLIYHVDGSYISANSYDINAGSHQGMYPMSAVATTANGVLTGDGAVSTSGCPWPGTGSRTQFTDATTPNSKSWAAANTAKPITNITESSGVIQFCFISCPPACTPPTTQASGANINNIGDNQMQVNWTRGNGTSVIVVAREGSPVDANPFNGINYTANAAYGSGTELGTGNYVVYKGTANNVTVTGLTPGTLYFYSVYEYFTADNCFLLPGVTANALTTGVVPSYCDTLSQFCCTPTIYTSTNGYVGGTNEYDCQGVAEYFADPSPYNQVTGARIFLAAANNGTNPNVTFVLYDNANGGPTNQMATAVIPMATVVTAFNNDGYIDVDFGGTYTIPAGGFSVGFLIPGTPASGDTLAVVTNSDAEGDDTGYCMFAGAWSSYNGAGWGITLENAIFPFTCFQNDLPPIAGFSGNPTRIPMGSNVQFTDQSAGTSPTSWSWTFSGGSPATSTDVNPLVTYSAVGFYDVSLTVSNANGTDTETKVAYIEVFDPNGTTAFSLDFEACTDFQVDDFAPWTTNDVDGGATYGVTGTTFPNSGYTGSFIAMNPANTTPPLGAAWTPHGGDLCGACMNAVTASAPNNDWLISTQIDLGVNSSFSFWAKSVTDQWGLERFVVWISTTGNAPANFTTKLSAGTYLSAPLAWTEYTYDLSAYDGQTVYVAVQCVSNDAFAFLIDDIEIYSEYVAPTCDFVASNTAPTAGSTVNFTDLSTQMPTSWSWSFPGGTPSTSTSQNPSVVYNTPGTYDVTLTVTNAQGTDTEVKTGYISVSQSIVEWTFPTSSANAASDGGIAANNGTRNISLVGATTLSYPTGGATENCASGVSWTYVVNTKWWQVSFTTSGYGTLKLSSKQTGDNSRSPRDFKVQYSLDGSAWTDVPGATVTCPLSNWTTTGNLTNIALPAACENQTLVYLRWLQTSNFAIGGGTNIQAAQNSKIDDIIVTGLPYDVPPVADFSANDVTPCVGQSVTFTDATTNSPTSWSWTFAGGTPATSNAQNPVVTYATPGTYQVSLTATNGSGSDTETKVAYITVSANPTISASNAGPYCVGQTIALNATGSGGTSYSWTGPATFTSSIEDPTRTGALVTHAGTYTVVLTNTTTGCAASATTDVTVNANPTISAANTGPYCAGSTISLNATGAGGNTFAWTGPNSFSTSTEDPTITNGQTVNAGTYTVTYTNTTSGCTASANTVVTVNANPTVSPVNGGPYCSGQTITLTSNGAGGTSYSWSGPNGFTSTAANPTIANGQTVNTGTYTVVLTNTTSGCTVSGTTTVTVNASPTISAANSGPHCAGATLTLSATGSGGTQYAWTGPNTFTSALEDPTIANAQTVNSGLYTVVLTNTTSGCTASATTTATINANPTVSASNTGAYCAGQTIALNATGAGGTSYAWTGPASFTSALEDPTRASSLTTHSGTYTVVLTNTTSGCTASATTNVTVNANPTLSASNSGPYCEGQTIALNATGSGGTSYAWTGPASFTSAVEDPTRASALITHSGTYTVVLTNTTSGCTASATTNVTVNANPTLSASNSGPYCVGQTIALNATGSGGTSYAWTGPASFTSAVEDPTRASALTTHSGTYTVVLTNTTSGCTATANTLVTVNANPTLSASNTGPYCAGQTIVLNATGAGGTSYAWTGPASFTSALEDPTRASSLTTHSGTYTVVLTNTTSGCTATANTVVTVNANPTLSASNNGPLCAGSTLNLSATGAGGTQYAWTGPNTYTSSTEDPSIANAQVVNSGTYTVILTNTTSGCTATATTTATINANPTVSAANNGPLCAGTALNLSATGAGGTQYAWTGPNSYTSSTEDPSIANAQVVNAGTYTVVLTNTTSGCTASATTSAIINANPTVSAVNDGPHCAGATLNLNATGAGGTSYAWTGPNGFTSSLEDPSVSNAQVVNSGVYTVVLTNTTTLCTASATTTATINANPTISAVNNGPICAGSSLNLNATGAGGTNYSWSGPNGFTSAIEDPSIANAQIAASGIYTVVLTNTTSGCNASATTTAVVNANPTISASNDGPYCVGETINLSATGAGGTNYSWTGPLAFVSAIEDPSRASSVIGHSGIYTVTLTNTVSGCTASASTTVAVNANPTVEIGTTINECPGNTVVLDAGAGLSYEWSTLATSQTISVTTGGTYTVTVTNGSSCSASDNVVVNFYPQTTLAMSSNPESGTGANDGTATVTPTGTAPFTFTWSVPQSTPTISGLAGGNYTVTVTDGNACTVSGIVNVATLNTPPVADFTVNDQTICAGTTVNFTDLSTNSPTTWSWNFIGGVPATSNIPNPSVTYATAGVYEVTLIVTNIDGSDIETKTGYISVFPNPTLSASNTGPYCVGNTISLNATGSGGDTYAWSGPAGFNSSLEDPTRAGALLTHAGTYNVVLTNIGSGCTTTANTVVTVNANPTVSANNNGPLCAGASLNLNATGSGGTQYAWTGPNTFTSATEDPTIANAQVVNGGIYTVVLTNTTTGCNASATTTATINANPTVSASSNAPLCAGSTLSLNATGSGGTQYAWTGPNAYTSSLEDPSIANAQPVNSGSYTVVYTNTTTGCTASAATTATINVNPTVSAVNDGPACVGETLNLSATGVGGTQYAWTGPNTYTSTSEDPSVSNVQIVNSGTYTVVITNTTSGCTASATTTATINANPTISASNDGPHCAGATLNLSATGAGGTQYSWSGPDGFTSILEDPTIANAQTVNSGVYTVVLTNATSGCTASASTTVTVNANPTISASNDSPACVGETVILNANGVGGDSYSWTGPDSFTSTSEDPTITNVALINDGTYTVVLANSTSGCTTSASTIVQVNANPTVSTSNTGAYCVGETISLSATGAGATQYEWSGPDGFTSSIVNPIIANAQLINGGTYTVVLTNLSTGCTATDNTIVVVNAVPVISAVNDGPYCEGETISLNSTGTDGDTYSWSGPDGFTSADEDPIIAGSTLVNQGTYTVVLTNSGTGCNASATTTAVVNANPSLTVVNDGPACEGETINLTASGSGGDSYSWTGPALFSSIDQNPVIAASTLADAGLYTAVITNTVTGCTASASTVVVVNANPTLSATNDGPYCEGSDINLSTLASGGDSFSWIGPDGFTSTDASPVIIGSVIANAGTYDVTYTNTATGCFATASSVVNVNLNPVVELGADITECDYTGITLDAGVGYMSYEWNGSVGTQFYTPSVSDLYTVIVEDNNGCTATDFVNVTINESPSLLMSATDESGTGFNDGTATVTISGGLNPYDVIWSNLETTETITGLTGGLYSVVVTDDNGCTAYDEITVNTLNAAPVASFSADVIEGCVPLVVNFTDESTNIPLTWLWNFDGTNTANTQDASFTFDTPGTYNVSLYVENLDGNDTYQVEINVYGNPTPELGDNITECDGNTVVLDAGDMYTSYFWTGDFDTQTLDVTVGGDYYVTVTDANGCTGVDMISILFNPSPVIELGDDFSICANVEYTLDAGEGFASYLWNGSIVGQTLTVTEAGTYTVEVTNNFYCPATDAVTITELPAPSVDLPATIDACVNDEFTYELTETYESVLWSDATTEHTFTNTWTEVGEYEISVTVYLGTCTDIDYMTVMVDICENVDITDSEQFIGLYPNPANELSNLIIQGYTGEISYVLVDAQGKEIVAKTIGVNSDYSEELDLENLVPGMYFVRVTTNKEVTNLKLIRK